MSMTPEQRVEMLEALLKSVANMEKQAQVITRALNIFLSEAKEALHIRQANMGDNDD